MEIKQDLELIDDDLRAYGQAQKIADASLNDEQEYRIRDKEYTELLHSYIAQHAKKSKKNGKYKFVFFCCVMLVFFGVVILSVVSIVFLARREEASFSDIGIVLGAAASCVSAIIVLPRIIAEHLFPKDEDSNMINLIQTMQQNDCEIRKTCCNDEDKKK